MTSHELPLSMYTRFTYLSKILAFMITGLEEFTVSSAYHEDKSFAPDNDSWRVHGLHESDSILTCRMPVYFLVEEQSVVRFLVRKEYVSVLPSFIVVPGGISLELARAFLVIIQSFVGCDFFCFDPSVSLLHQTLVSSWESIICIPGNESSSTFSFLLLDVMHCEMCLRKLLLLAKIGSKLCLQIFVVENATCLLTIPPYTDIIFKRIGEHMTGHEHCPFLHTNGTFEEVGGPPKEELPPELGKDDLWVARRLPPC
ncbi:hypothetical protein Tco_0052411 [Tanacetum coccineum]